MTLGATPIRFFSSASTASGYCSVVTSHNKLAYGRTVFSLRRTNQRGHSILLLPQHPVHDPAPADMRPLSPAVFENVCAFYPSPEIHLLSSEVTFMNADQPERK